MKKHSNAQKGFSLVEVAMALAIAAFCLVTLLGMLSLGVHNYQQSGSHTTMVNLSTAVVQDLEATTPSGSASETSPRFLFVIPATGTYSANPPLQTVFMDATGANSSGTVKVGNALSNTTPYRVSVSFYPPQTAGQVVATTARVLVTYPAQADPTGTTAPVNYTSMFETMVSLNRN